MDPIINILTRTSNRPNYFRDCIKSIRQQSFSFINHIVATDDVSSIEYIKSYDINPLYIDPSKYKHNTYKLFDYHNGEGKGESPAWWNVYFNDMYPFIKEGWVMFLDDDDSFSHSDSLKYLIPYLSNPDNLLFWKVQFPHCIVPNVGSPSLEISPPIYCNISGIGFMFHSNYLKYAKWDEWGGGDFRISSRLWDVIPNKIQIDHILTQIQDVPHLGNLQDKSI